MNELTTPPLEGRVVPRRGLKVKELIEKLSEMDPEVFVVTSDCCHGTDPEPQVYIHELESGDRWVAIELGISVGDTCVMIN